MSERLYFAYGSNINLDQMARRCPNAEVVGPATLNGYRLAFRSQSGVATILPAPAKQVKGLLWRLTPECEQSLDRYEGHPHFYYKDERINVLDKAGKEYTVMAYVMSREFEWEPHMPSMPYYMGIAEGYKQNGIPFRHLHNALDACKQEIEMMEQNDRRKQFRFNFSMLPPNKQKKPKPPER